MVPSTNTITTTTTKYLLWVLLLHLLLQEVFIEMSSCKSITCIESEKQALLSFKEGLNDPSNHLSTWSPDLQEDCCLWTRVLCNHTTSHVSELHLGNANLSGNLTDSLLSLNYVTYLDLSGNDFKGIQIPSFLGSMKALQYLNLSKSSLAGYVPQELGSLSSLKVLSLASNELIGPLPVAIGSLSNLETLALGNNALSGVVSQAHFTNCLKLKALNVTSTDLLFNFSSSWIPPFQLESVYLSYTQVGPRFPSWLQTQVRLNYLFLAYSGIGDTVPQWFWSWVSHVHHVDLTGNQIYGDLSNITLNSTMIRLSSNNFTGQLPVVSPNVRWLTLRNNSLTGKLSAFLCNKDHRGNNMQQLALQMNKLHGELSDCWENWQSLIMLNLACNQLLGRIPTSMSSPRALKALHLHRNKLVGSIPISLQNLTSLFYLNLEHNELSGEIPSWIGENYSKLSVINLSSNKFTGSIPLQLCNLSFLLVLSLANNSISGTIPNCLNNLTLMVTTNAPKNFNLDIVINDPMGNLVGTFTEYVDIYSKGSIRLYDKTLKLIRVIDLSSNQLTGLIPGEVCDLKGLRFLNLSSNRLTGMIPKRIGEIQNLESLDISMNLIKGEIPESMTMLTSLASLNMSYNKLWGRIPTSTQLQSFDRSCYVGNTRLCGPPTGLSCGGVENGDKGKSLDPARDLPADENGDGDEKFDIASFLGSMGLGFAFGFLVVCVVFFVSTRNAVHDEDEISPQLLYYQDVIDWFK